MYIPLAMCAVLEQMEKARAAPKLNLTQAERAGIMAGIASRKHWVDQLQAPRTVSNPLPELPYGYAAGPNAY